MLLDLLDRLASGGNHDRRVVSEERSEVLFRQRPHSADLRIKIRNVAEGKLVEIQLVARNRAAVIVAKAFDQFIELRASLIADCAVHVLQHQILALGIFGLQNANDFISNQERKSNDHRRLLLQRLQDSAVFVLDGAGLEIELGVNVDGHDCPFWQWRKRKNLKAT